MFMPEPWVVKMLFRIHPFYSIPKPIQALAINGLSFNQTGVTRHLAMKRFWSFVRMRVPATPKTLRSKTITFLGYSESQHVFQLFLSLLTYSVHPQLVRYQGV